MRFVDLLLADLMGIPRGKRVTIDELRNRRTRRPAAAGSMFALDVLGGTIQATGLGFDEGDADRICLPIAGTLVPVPWLGDEGRADAGQRCTSTTAGRFTAIRATCWPRVLERFSDLGLTPVIAVELEFYLRRSASARPRAARSRRASRCPVAANSARRSTRWRI